MRELARVARAVIALGFSSVGLELGSARLGSARDVMRRVQVGSDEQGARAEFMVVKRTYRHRMVPCAYQTHGTRAGRGRTTQLSVYDVMITCATWMARARARATCARGGRRTDTAPSFVLVRPTRRRRTMHLRAM